MQIFRLVPRCHDDGDGDADDDGDGDVNDDGGGDVNDDGGRDINDKGGLGAYLEREGCRAVPSPRQVPFYSRGSAP